MQVLALALLVLTQTGAPAVFAPPTAEQRLKLFAPRAEAKPVLDGRLDDAAWARPGTGHFVQAEPRQGAPATNDSTVWVAWDDDALYVAARLEQPGGLFAFNQRDLRRDWSTIECDAFTVILDTFGDGRNAFSFAVNPYGAQRDQQVIDDELFEANWDTVWRSATARDEQGWTVELAIPWKSLRYREGGSGFGIQFFRRERGRNEDTAWSPFPRTFSAWRMTYAGQLEGVTPPPPRLLALQVRPYATARVERLDDGPPSFVPGAGGEVTWTPSSATVVDLTVNTDFAETDVDRRVVNLSRFSVFFPERRQFFLESAGVFSVGDEGFLQPYFSRRIGLENGQPVPIAAGLRAVYRTPERSAGALFVQTLAARGAAPSLFGVGRYTQHVGAQSRVGGLVAARHDYAFNGEAGVTNVVPAVDGVFRSGSLTLRGSAMGSATWAGRDPTFGAAAYAEAELDTNLGSLEVWAAGVSPRFEARTGFVGRENMIGTGMLGSLDWRPPTLPGFLRNLGTSFDGYLIWSADRGEFQEANLWYAPLTLLLSGGDDIFLITDSSIQQLSEPFAPVPGVEFAPGRYSYSRLGLYAASQASRRVQLTGEVTGGRYYSSNLVRSVLGASVQPLPHVQVAAHWEYNRFWGDGVRAPFAESHLLRLETRLAVSPKLQLIGSYQRDTAGNGSVLNARLAWEFLPLSFLYVVFTDTRSLFPFDGAAPSEQRLVAKVTFTWRP